MTFLGHVVSKEGIRVDPAKLRQLDAGRDLLHLLRFGVLWDWQAIIDDLFRVSLLLQLH